MPKHIVRLLYQSHFSFMLISSFSCWLAVLRLFSLSSFFCCETILPICQYERMAKKEPTEKKEEKKNSSRETSKAMEI
jgi:hypothetical protein